ncbi:DUF2244 domain-containing protein [Massilia sp.]|uniref:DUF2244 domain-containing protein n=1 Tax=Massilia sp. TaxID=1882437 RepID=UPI002899BE8B|nr:DUF2244 domain-containing protein [Massilia sp.]
MKREWLMRRNCSLTPRQALQVYLLLSSATLGIAAVFTWRGAWMVLAFALVETAAVGTALLHYARHALDRERLVLADGWLLVERDDGSHHIALRLEAHAVRVSLPDERMRTLIRLETRAGTVEVGRFITPPARRAMVNELRRALPAGALR